MTTTQDDDAWLATLSGKAAPTDLATRQAAQAREYFLHQAEDEDLDVPDQATQIRIMNLLRAKGAFNEPAAVSPHQGWLAGIWAWIAPPGQGRGAGMAIAAGIAVAALSLPLVLRSPEPDDSASVKGLPKVPGPAQPPISQVPSIGERLVLTADPSSTGRDLAQALGAAGAQVQVSTSGAEVLLTATVPPAAASRASGVLAAYGLPLPGDGQLRVRLARP